MWKASRNIFVLSLVISLASAAVAESLTSVALALDQEFATAVNPLVQGVVAIGSYLCPILTAVLVPGPEPDLSKLNLQYRSIDSNTTIEFELPTVAEEIPRLLPGYNSSDILYIFVHGFGGNLSKDAFVNLNTALQLNGQYNVLGFDVSSLISEDFNYFKAASYVKYGGNALGKALVAIIQASVYLADKIYLIGHSLGAHICGFAGYTVRNLIGILIGRITGLDPAGPCYSNLPAYLKLSEAAAKFVDAIHTNRGLFGINQLVGHVDFFPNGGSNQPGCAIPTCSHSRTPPLFTESVYTPNAFPAVACASEKDFHNNRCSNESVPMGYFCPNTTRGLYFLQTADTSPYGLGAEGARYNATRAGLLHNILK